MGHRVMHRTEYTVQKAAFGTEVYGASSHRMDSGCCMYCNPNSVNIPTLTRKSSIVVLSFDLLYVHLEVSPAYPLTLVRFSVKMVKFQKQILIKC